MGLEERIEAIEAEIAETPYNKSTEQHIGRLKAKLADLREQLGTTHAGEGGGEGYHVAQSGDATVVLVGFPSVGKSTLLNALTNAESTVGAYDFTTLEVQPGMLEFRGAKLQLLDVPGLIQGAADGRGRGREVLSVVRSADLVLIVLSPYEVERYHELTGELATNMIRLDRSPPRISIEPTQRGGINVTTAADLDLNEGTVAEVLREHGYVNANVRIAEPVDIDRLIDGIMDNRVYIPSLVVVNKIDLVDGSDVDRVRAELTDVGLDPAEVPLVSATTEVGLDELREHLWGALELQRVYLREPGEAPEYDDPLIVTRGTTVEEVVARLGGRFEDRVRYARVTGPSAHHDEQRVGFDHELEDEDVLTLVLRR